MLFMCRETGELYELLITAVEDVGLSYIPTADRAWAIGTFTLFGSGEPNKCMNSELHLRFEFLGII